LLYFSLIYFALNKSISYIISILLQKRNIYIYKSYIIKINSNKSYIAIIKLVKNSKKKDEVDNSPSQYTSDINKFNEFADEIKKKYKITNYDLLDLLLKKKTETQPEMIPVSIFDNNELSALESITKYMRENLYFGSGKIAKLLNRNISTISSTYIKAKGKLPAEFAIGDSKFFIPISEISTRKFSVLESIVKFLKEKCSLTNIQIAKLLNRNSKTIWTVYTRAKKKEATDE